MITTHPLHYAEGDATTVVFRPWLGKYEMTGLVRYEVISLSEFKDRFGVPFPETSSRDYQPINGALFNNSSGNKNDSFQK